MTTPLSASSTLPQGKIRTADEVEDSGVWVSADNSGYHQITVSNWRRSGLLAKGRDYFRERVRLARGGPIRGDHFWIREIWFYRRSALARLAKQHSREAAESKRSEKWKAAEQIVENGVVLVLGKTARQVLGIDKSLLYAWTNHGCPLKDEGKKLETVLRVGPAHRTVQYWKLAELEEIRSRRTNGTTGTIPTYANAKTMELTGLKPSTLRRARKYEPLGLVKESVPMPSTATRRTAGTGKSRWQRTVRKARFTCQSVDAYVRNIRATTPPVAPGRKTVADAVRLLRVSQPTVNRWCHLGILDAEWRDVLRSGYAGGIWLITDRSIREASRVIRKYGIRRAWEHLLALKAKRADSQPVIAPPKGSRPTRPIEPVFFVATEREILILELLKGRAKKLAQLAATLRVDPASLCAREIKRLKKAGKIRQIRGVGYVRLDVLPDFAQSQRQ